MNSTKSQDQPKFPEVVYKYRDWNDPNHKRFITHKEIYMASALSFEDNQDCKNMVRYDLMNESQKDQWFTRMIKKKYPWHNRSQIRKEVNNVKKGHRINDTEKVREFNEESFIAECNRSGVLSLTENNENTYMWKKYANCKKGFCIGYNPKVLFPFLGGGGNVQYVDELPLILPRPIMEFDQQVYNNIFTKLRKWEFEDEYRTHMFWDHVVSIEDRQIEIPVEAFHSIILGSDMPNDSKEEIKLAVKASIGEHVDIIE